MAEIDNALPRLSKRMGELGLCSRREADVWISKGWVKVDGKVVDTLGVRVSREARIEVVREATAEQNEPHTIAQRVGCYLARRGLLERDADNTYLTQASMSAADEDPSNHLFGS